MARLGSDQLTEQRHDRLTRGITRSSRESHLSLLIHPSLVPRPVERQEIDAALASSAEETDAALATQKAMVDGTLSSLELKVEAAETSLRAEAEAMEGRIEASLEQVRSGAATVVEELQKTLEARDEAIVEQANKDREVGLKDADPRSVSF